MNKPVYDDVTIRLLDAGIHTEALRTTLPRENRSDIREFIENEEYIKEDGSKTNLIFSSSPNTADSTLLLMHLVAKELLLSGMDTKFTLLDSLSSYDMLSSSPKPGYLFISGFYLSSRSSSWSSFYPPDKTEILQHVITKLYYRFNVGFAIYCDGGISNASKWWPDQLVEFFKRTGLTIKGS